MVDLDLDVILRADGNLILDDEDEFDEHRVALGYPDDVVRLARDSSREVLDAIALGVEPFLSAGHARLLQARADGATGPAS
jgi:protein associated with RNAse G/E